MIYLIEIKNRFILLLVTFFSTFIICYCYKDVILFLTMDIASIKDSELNSFNFIFTGVTELFYVYLRLVISVSWQISLFHVILHLIAFLIPALYKQEIILVNSYLYILMVSFSFTVTIVLNYIFPVSWQFFYSFQLDSYYGESLNLESRIIEFVEFFVSVYSFSIIYFQSFVFFILVLKDYFCEKFFAKKFRKMIFLCFAIFSTLFSPPDIYSQLFFLIIFILIYELILFFNFLNTNWVRY